MRIALVCSFMILLMAGTAGAQGVPIKSGAGSDLMTVNAQKAGLVSDGISTRPTYIASTGAVATTTAYSLQVESSVSTGFKVSNICVSISNATAAAAVNVVVRRTTAASTAGTALTAEGTGTTAVSKMDPADGNFGGVARSGGTTTNGATLDQWGFMVGELGAGTADVPSNGTFCKPYGTTGEKMPTVVSGVANGISIAVSAPGAGGLAMGAVSATIIAE